MTMKKLGALLLSPCLLTATPYVWNGVNDNCDLQMQTNWDCSCQPGAADTERFPDLSPMCFSPSSDDGISINNFDFPGRADIYEFTISTKSKPLQFNGMQSITGTNTNTSITCHNTDNTNNTLLYQLNYANVSSNDTGSALITLDNSGTLNSGTGLSLSYLKNYQIGVAGPLTIPTGANFIISNTGTNHSSGDHNYVGYVDSYQLYTPYALTIGDNVTFTLSSSGYNYSKEGQGGNQVGNVDAHFETDAPTQIGNNVTFNLSNYGFIGAKSSTTLDFESVGYMGDAQIKFGETVQTGDYFTLNVINSGEDQGDTGGNYVGAVDGRAAVYFDYGGTFGSNATISHTNQGIGEGTYTSGNDYIGYLNCQIYFDDPLIASDYFTMSATNIGTDSSTSPGGNEVGITDDDPQIYMASSVKVGDYATFNLSNTGSVSGAATNQSYVGYVDSSQFWVSDAFQAGDYLTISLINEGTNTSSNPNTLVGYVATDQFTANNTFSAGQNLTLTATNEGTGEGNYFGYVNGSQINFANTCTINDGTYIYAANNGSGTVVGPQIFFQQGFDLTGKATIQATNSLDGSIGQGITVGAGSGGNVDIILENSTLYIPSNASTFTIGSLKGDSSSVVQSGPQLIINNDAGLGATFGGSIQDFGQGQSSLVKTGPGTQELSGPNTFTGLALADDGMLVLNGSLTSDLKVVGTAILKGNGTIMGHVTNTGTIYPGQSIGTIHFFNGFDNLGGNYFVEVSDSPSSSLIDVIGTANIEGGLVTVDTVDGTYAFHHRYTILDATVINGDYSGAVALNPLIAPVLSEDPQHIYLTILTDISSAAHTCNQRLIAAQLDGITSLNPDLKSLLNLIVNLPLSDVPAALDDLVGYQHGSDLFTTVAINRQFIRRLYDPIRKLVTNEPGCYCPCNASVWVEGGGVFTEMNGRDSMRGFHTSGYEVTAGLQATFSSAWTVGVAGSYEHDHLNFKRGGGHGNHTTWFAGLYGLYRPSCFYALADFAYGHSSNRLDRHFTIGTDSFRARSKPKIHEYTFYGEGGYDLCVCNILVQPFVGIEAGSFQRNHVVEQYASGTELDIKNRGVSLGVSRLGCHFTTHNYGLDLSFDLAWNYRFSQTSNTFRERFVEFGKDFDLCNGPDLVRNSVDYALTLSTCFDCNWDFYIEGLGESWTHSHIFSILGGVQYSW